MDVHFRDTDADRGWLLTTITFTISMIASPEYAATENSTAEYVFNVLVVARADSS